MSEINQWIMAHGVSYEVLQIVVFIPLIATLISLARYFVGFKAFGVYAPIILAIAYKYTGLRYGLIITTLVVLSSIITYSVLKRIRMHYITRISVNYTIMSVMIVLGIAVVDAVPALGFDNFTSVNPLGVISIAALSDFFVKMHVKKGIEKTVRTLLENLIISILGWYIITSKEVVEYLLNNLWFIPVILLINILTGKYTGLRFKDLFRFKALADDTRENKEN